MLGQQPDNIKKCKEFIMMCQSKIGGFGRQINAVPSLESTYHAIKSLKILKVKF
ncbi:MAG: hypothetical protein QXG00_01620 [Candidatus Woesearchaeota archaeon]